MTGNLLGEQFENYVFDQIRDRQELNASGFGTSLKTPDQIQVLNNKNSFLKLASGVDFFGVTPIPTQQEAIDQGLINENEDFTENFSIPGLRGSTLSEIGIGKYKLLEEQIIENNKIQSAKGNEKLKNLGFSPKQINSLGLGSTLAKKSILFGGLGELKGGSITKRSGINTSTNLWDTTSAYGLGGSQFGKQPMPGITSATVDCINRGSIRSANITIKAYNTFQFQLLELLYLRLGFTMMLEWGHSKYVDGDVLNTVGSTLIEDMFFDDKGYSQLEVLKTIEEYRKKYSGNYDGFFGRVTNFSWDFNPDGTYNINLKLVTLGDIIESLQINIPTQILSFSNNTDGDSVNSNSTLEKWLDDEVKADVKNRAVWANGKYINLKNLNYNPAVPFKYKGKTTVNQNHQRVRVNAEKEAYDKLLKEEPWRTSKLGITEGLTNENSYFVTFQTLLEKIFDNVIPRVENKSSTPILGMGFDEKLNIVSAQPNQISFDLSVCFVKPMIYLPSINKSSLESAYVKDFFVLEKDGDEDLFYGQLMNVYLNFDFVKKQLNRSTDKEGMISLFKFLESICDGINSSLGNVNKIEPIINAEKNEIVFIDQNPIRGNAKVIQKLLDLVPDPTDVVPFQIYGIDSSKNQSNFVKSFKFDTKIDSKLASMITIGTTAGGSQSKVTDGTAFSNWNAGLIDRFQKKIIPPKKFLTPAQEEEAAEANFDDQTREILANWWGKTDVAEKTDRNNVGTKARAAFRVLGQEETNPDKLSWDIKSGRQGRKTHLSRFNTKSGEYKGYSFEFLNLIQFQANYIQWKKTIGKNILASEDVNLSSSYQSWLTFAFGGNIVGKENTDGEAFKVQQKEAMYLNLSNANFYKQGKQAFKEYIRLRDQKIYRITGSPSNQQGFIPVELSLTLDGLSGIKIYQKINIEQKFLPSEYQTSALSGTLDFIIQKVNHKIAEEKWETSLSTISIPPTKTVNNEVIDDGLFTFLGISNGVNLTGDRTITGTAPRILATELTPSSKVKEELKSSEALRLKAYDDPGSNSGLPITIGYGQTFYAPGQQYTRNGELKTQGGKSFDRLKSGTNLIQRGDTITEQSADSAFNQIANNFGSVMITAGKLIVPMTQNEYDALLHFSYNAGKYPSSAKAPLYKLIRDKDYVSAGAQLERTLVGNEDKPNLWLSRRQKEADIWYTNNPGNTPNNYIPTFPIMVPTL